MKTLILLALGAHIVVIWAVAIWRGIRARHIDRCRETASPEVWPSVSIIVPAWQERGTLEACVRTLRMVDYPKWEVIIVARGSDGTYDAALRACVDDARMWVTEQQPRGKNAALNEGLRRAHGELVVILDADSLVSPGWLRALVQPLQGDVVATTGNFFPLRRSLIALESEIEKIAVYEILGMGTLQGSGSIALKRETIETIGGFPEDVFVGVDWDLDARLAMLHLVRAFCPKAVLYTERPATLAEWWNNELRWRRAHLSSLFRLRGYFLGDLLAAARNLQTYIMAWFSLAFTASIILVILIGRGQLRTDGVVLWITFLVWWILYSAKLAIEVAIFRRQAEWLRAIWVMPLLQLVTFVAAIVASLTISHTTVHFKGPRRYEGFNPKGGIQE